MMSVVPQVLLAQDSQWHGAAVMSSDDSYASQARGSPESPLSSAERPPKKRRKIDSHTGFIHSFTVNGVDFQATFNTDRDGFQWFDRQRGLHKTVKRSVTSVPKKQAPPPPTHSQAIATSAMSGLSDANDTQLTKKKSSDSTLIRSDTGITESGMRQIRSKLSLVRGRGNGKSSQSESQNDEKNQHHQQSSVSQTTGKEEASDSDLISPTVVQSRQKHPKTQSEQQHCQNPMDDVDESPPPPTILIEQRRKHESSLSNGKSEAQSECDKLRKTKEDSKKTQEKIVVMVPVRKKRRRRRRKKNKKRTDPKDQNNDEHSDDNHQRNQATLSNNNNNDDGDLVGMVDAQISSDLPDSKEENSEEERRLSENDQSGVIPDYPPFRLSSKSHSFVGKNAAQAMREFEEYLVKESKEIVQQTYHHDKNVFNFLLDAVCCANDLYASKIPALSAQLASEVISVPVCIDVERGLLRSEHEIRMDDQRVKKEHHSKEMDAISAELESIQLEISSSERHLSLMNEINERLSGMHEFQSQIRRMVDPKEFVNERMREMEECHTAVYLSVEHTSVVELSGNVDGEEELTRNEDNMRRMLQSKRIQFEDCLADELEALVDHLDAENTRLLFKWDQMHESQSKLNRRVTQLEMMMDEKMKQVSRSHDYQNEKELKQRSMDIVSELVECEFQKEQYEQSHRDQIQSYDRSKYIIHQ